MTRRTSAVVSKTICATGTRNPIDLNDTKRVSGEQRSPRADSSFLSVNGKVVVVIKEYVPGKQLMTVLRPLPQMGRQCVGRTGIRD